jgi:DNA-binding NarL/FixJ family response regulator
MKRISVLLVEDHAVVREGLRALLTAEDDIEVVDEARNGRAARKKEGPLGAAPEQQASANLTARA